MKLEKLTEKEHDKCLVNLAEKMREANSIEESIKKSTELLNNYSINSSVYLLEENERNFVDPINKSILNEKLSKKILIGDTYSCPSKKIYPLVGKKELVDEIFFPKNKERVLGALLIKEKIEKIEPNEEFFKNYSLSLAMTIHHGLEDLYAKDKPSEIFRMSAAAMHDLKTHLAPASAIVQMMEMGHYGTIDETAKNYLKDTHIKIMEAATMIESYIENLKQSSFEIEKSPVDLINEVVIEDVIWYKSKLDEKNMEVDLFKLYRANAKDRGLVVNGDIHKLKVIFKNVFSNAIRYGKEGTNIIIDSEKSGEDASIYVRNEVESFIPEEQLKNLFNFKKQGTERLTSMHSSKIGLYTVKLNMDMHLGEVAVRNFENAKDSKKYFEISLAFKD